MINLTLEFQEYFEQSQYPQNIDTCQRYISGDISESVKWYICFRKQKSTTFSPIVSLQGQSLQLWLYASQNPPGSKFPVLKGIWDHAAERIILTHRIIWLYALHTNCVGLLSPLFINASCEAERDWREQHVNTVAVQTVSELRAVVSTLSSQLLSQPPEPTMSRPCAGIPGDAERNKTWLCDSWLQNCSLDYSASCGPILLGGPNICSGVSFVRWPQALRERWSKAQKIKWADWESREVEKRTLHPRKATSYCFQPIIQE